MNRKNIGINIKNVLHILNASTYQHLNQAHSFIVCNFATQPILKYFSKIGLLTRKILHLTTKTNLLSYEQAITNSKKYLNLT